MSHNIVYNIHQQGCLSYHIWWTDASSSSLPRLQPSFEPHRARGWLSFAQWQHRRWQDQAPVWRLIAIHSAKGDFTHLLGDGKVEPELSPSSEASLEKRVRFKYFEARRIDSLQRRKVWTSPWRHIGFERHQSLTVKRVIWLTKKGGSGSYPCWRLLKREDIRNDRKEWWTGWERTTLIISLALIFRKRELIDYLRS